MILAWDNKGDLAVVTAGSQIATLPAANVQNLHLSKKWHTAAGVKNSHLVFDMGSQLSCSMFGLFGSNLSKNATLRMRASPTDAEADADVTLDTGVIYAAALRALSVPGSGGNNATTPDSPQNSITGDIEIRAKLRLFQTGATQCVLAKWQTGVQGSFRLIFNSGGGMRLMTSPDGVADDASQTSTVGISFGVTTWVRATRVAATGIINYETSNDYDEETETGTWTALGAANRTSTAGNIFDSTSQIELTTSFAGAAERMTGLLLYAEVRRGIGGPIASRFWPQRDAVAGATSFTSVDTREVWTINQTGTPKAEIVTPEHANLKAGYGALYKVLKLAWLNAPGRTGNYASTPDTAANSVTGDIEIRVKLMLVQTATTQCAFAKWQTGLQGSVRLIFVPGGAVRLMTSPDGAADDASQSSTVGILAGVTIWVKATRVAATGIINYETSNDYDRITGTGTWTALGAANRTSTAGNIFNSTSQLEIGTSFAGAAEPLQGNVLYVEMRNGINGPVVASFDPNRGSDGATSIVSASGETWTVNQSGSPKAELLVRSDFKARYWRPELADHSLPDNLQIGRVFIGPGWKHEKSLLYGWGVTPLDESPIEETQGGQSFPDVRPKRRQLDFALDYLSEAEIFDNAFAMARANGVVKDVLAIPIENGDYLSEQAVWGFCLAHRPLVHRLSKTFRQQFTVRERL